jgi:hypothetical protein
MIASQTLRCLEPGCSQAVIYEPRPVVAGNYKPAPRLRVYLRCALGHEHCYVVHPREDLGREAPTREISEASR